MNEALLEQLPFALSYLRQAGCDRAAAALISELGDKYPELRGLLGEGEEDEDTDGRSDAERLSDIAGGSSRRDTTDAASAGPSPRGLSTTFPNSSSNNFVLSAERAASLFKASVPPWGDDLDEYDSMEDAGYRRKAMVGRERDHFIEHELDLGSEEGSDAGGGAGMGLDGDDDGQDSQAGADEEQEAMFQPMPAAPPPPPSPQKPQQGAQGKSPPPVTPMPAVFSQYLANQGSATSSRQATASPGNSGTLPQVAGSSGAATTHGSFGSGSISDEPEWDKGPADIKLVDPVTTPRKERGAEEEPGGKPVLSRVESLSSSFKDFDLDDDDQVLGVPFGRCSRQASETGPGRSHSSRVGDGIEFSPPAAPPPAAGTILTEVMPSAEDAVDLFSHSRSSVGGRSGNDSHGGNQGVLEEAAERTLEFFARANARADSLSGKAGPPGPQSSALPTDVTTNLVLDAASPTGASIAALASMPFAADVSPSPTGASVSATRMGSLPLAVVGSPPAVESMFAGILRTGTAKDGAPASEAKICVVKKSDEPKEVLGGFSFPVTPSAEDTDSKLFKSWPSVRSSSMSELAPNLDDVSATCADYADDDYRSKLSSRTPSQKETRDTSTAPGSHCSTPSPRGQQHQHQQLGLPRGRDSVGPGAGASGTGHGTRPQSSAGEQSDSVVASVSAGLGDADAHAEPSEATAPGPSQAGGSGALSDAPADVQERAGWDGTSSALLSVSTSERQGQHKQEQGSPSLPAPTHQPGGSSPEVKDVLAEEKAGADARTCGDGGKGGLADDSGGEGEDAMDWHDPAGEEEELDEAEAAAHRDADAPLELLPKYTIDESGAILYHYDPDYIHKKYEIFNLQVIHRRHHTGFEETKDFPIRMNDLIAGRYQVVDFLGSAAFSRAVQAVDIKTNALVCLKIVKNSKDYLDQSLDEIKLLKYVNMHDPHDSHGIVRLYDYFYYKEHLFLVCELLRANLYEFQKYNKESNEDLYFTNARIQKIAISVLKSLAFLHSLDLIHSDLKPENILIKSYSRCEVKVIDLGSSCFTTDQLSSYVQSRSYRAPEVILGLPYDTKVDIWSLGCILAELSSGYVLFQNDSVATLLARLEGILGRVPPWMVSKGRYAHRYYTRSGQLFEHVQPPPPATPSGTSPSSQHSSKQRQSSGGIDPRYADRYEILTPKRSSLRHRVPDADDGLLAFIAFLLCVDPHKRPSAAEALCHPWLQHRYASLDC